MTEKESLVPAERIDRMILFIRSQKVMLDTDLAELYGVPTKRLNEQVKRNADRFPSDFVFQLNSDEKAELVANCDHLKRLRFSPTHPFAFTEHGALMLASVLNSRRAVETSVFVVRAFVKLRQMISANRALAGKVNELERRSKGHDEKIQSLVSAIRQLTMQPETKSKRIGFSKE